MRINNVGKREKIVSGAVQFREVVGF